jgi:hypothetical protein
MLKKQMSIEYPYDYWKQRVEEDPMIDHEHSIHANHDSQANTLLTRLT